MLVDLGFVLTGARARAQGKGNFHNDPPAILIPRIMSPFMS